VNAQTVAAPAHAGLAWDEPEIERSIPQRLRRVADCLPDQPAVQTEGLSYTFRELVERSNHLAAALAEVVTEPAARIPLLFAPGSALAVAAVYGVLRAGGCYTGLNPTAPLERNRAIWVDCLPAALLTDRQHADQAKQIANGERPVLVIEDLLAAPARLVEARPIDPDQLAALIYTSGSTGRPKGIELTHRQKLGRSRRTARTRGFGPGDRLVLSHQIAYSSATTSLITGLLSGATIFPIDLQQLSGPALLDFLRREAIAGFSMPIALFRQVMSQVDGVLELPHLRYLGLGGTFLLSSDVDTFRRHLPPTCLLDHSLATSEGGMVARNVLDSQTPITTPRIPVGRPIEGMEVLLWDDAGRPVPAGEPGEIVVRSAYLARGYWRNPELTEQVFLPDPDGGARRLYRTGDMGRWLPDGSLAHLGRKDQMVKIRGYRVELEEVELALQQLDSRQQTAVVARERDAREREAGELELVAFVVPPPGAAFSPVDLRRSLAAVLPDYMLPARFVRLQALPLTSSAKVDRQALRALPLPLSAPAETYAPPRDDLERQLTGLWESVLKVSPVGIHDNFFDLGGHSLAAIALLARVAKATGQSLAMTTLFQAPTVAQLAALLRGEGAASRLPPAIVNLQPLGSRPPVFLVPELEATAFNLVKLIRFMGVERPVYGLQPRGFEDGQRPFRTIPETAAYSVEAVRAVRPSGPYLLAGLCHGGTVAFEMARQLAAAGETIGGLYLVDLPPARPRDATLRERARGWVQNNRRRLRLWKSHTRERLNAARLPWTAPRQEAPPDAEPAATGLRPGRRLRYAQHLASLRYRASPLAGGASLILSAEYERRDRTASWQQLLPGGLEVEVVPHASHKELLGREIYLRAIANWLVRRLERAEAARPGERRGP
jgi:amino acid adenylation domain-containing protein